MAAATTATRAETSVVYAAGAVQGIVLVRSSSWWGLPLLSAVLLSLLFVVSLGLPLRTATREAARDAALDSGVRLPTIYAFSAAIAVTMGFASFAVTRVGREEAVASETPA